MRARLLPFGLAVLIAGAFVADAGAQSSRDAERRLERVKRELNEVARERRRLEDQRSDANRQLRQADEQVARSARLLRSTEAELQQQRTAITALQADRTALQHRLRRQREQLAGLLRAAYAIGSDAPLKVLLAQDRIADANRLLTYHGYLQRARAQRIAALTTALAALDALEREIAGKQVALERTRARQRTQLAALENDRRARAQIVSQLEQRYHDRNAREKVLGGDAKALERLLAQLRAMARQAAAAKVAAERAPSQAAATSAPSRKPVAVASAAPMQVGGLGWPLTGALLAGFGARLPDGRASTGLLIAAPAGTTVKAVADGSVVFSEWMTGYGMILIIDHGNGYMSLYAHNDALLRQTGDRVQRGDAVASVGNSGGQDRPGLYFELRRNGQPVNPNPWLQSVRSK